ncbi:aminomethyl transferase family protein [Streptomyces sp. ODS05-4]|uniref:aminomethyl transferase family protein n=1 Tax=Streptomyces sp. ODS05-4 TaxID=2944939 RepID=UPI00210EC785|nr:aminomethyl transferase family protein [Streptomyces sp. ODS05-4]
MPAPTPHRTAADDYTTLRTAVGAYPVTAPLVRITGERRTALLDRFLTRSGEFVEPDTVREALALHADGSPFAVLLHFEIDEDAWLLPRTPVTVEQLSTYLDQFELPDGVAVEIAPAGWGATAFEGPTAWSVAARFVDHDVSGLTLHAVTEAALPGAPDARAHLARVGTTGEYGYLLLSDAPGAAYETVLAAVREEGGAPVGPDALARVQAEAGMGVYAAGFAGLGVEEADLAWMVDWEREDPFHGSAALDPPTPDAARITALAAPAGSRIAPGTPVTAAGEPVGTVLWRAPSANPDEELLLALLRTPFRAPHLPLAAVDEDGVPHRTATVTLPRVLARSLTTRIA